MLNDRKVKNKKKEIIMTNGLIFRMNRHPLQNSLFKHFFDDVFADLEPFENKSYFQPKADIRELKDVFEITLEVAGLKLEDIEVTLNDNILEIKGQKNQQKLDDEDSKIHRTERAYGSFERKFKVPEMIHEQDIEATMKDGVLSVVLPKKQEHKMESKRRIEIKTS